MRVRRGNAVVTMRKPKCSCTKLQICESKGLKPFSRLIGSRVGSPGGVKLWVNWIEPVQPHLVERLGQLIVAAPLARDVALQVEFERQTLKPVFHLIGVRLWV